MKNRPFFEKNLPEEIAIPAMAFGMLIGILAFAAISQLCGH